jgi:GntR family transcriptional regulator, rspAB operon transcriptional repressor
VDIVAAGSDAGGATWPASDKDESLTQYVSRKLREEILAGALTPGRRIVQDSVARRFGTSRIPVREALRELASEGLVTIEPDVGARVAPMDPEDLIEVYMMREQLEPLAIRESVPRLDAVQLGHLQEVLAESERFASPQHAARYLELDLDFHRAVISACQRPRLNRTVESLWNAGRQYRRAYTQMFPSFAFEISIMEHRLIAEAVVRGAAEDAITVAQLHTRRTREGLAQRTEWLASGRAADCPESGACEH